MLAVARTGGHNAFVSRGPPQVRAGLTPMS
jgi:hypothetical protein